MGNILLVDTIMVPIGMHFHSTASGRHSLGLCNLRICLAHLPCNPYFHRPQRQPRRGTYHGCHHEPRCCHQYRERIPLGTQYTPQVSGLFSSLVRHISRRGAVFSSAITDSSDGEYLVFLDMEAFRLTCNRLLSGLAFSQVSNSFRSPLAESSERIHTRKPYCAKQRISFCPVPWSLQAKLTVCLLQLGFSWCSEIVTISTRTLGIQMVFGSSASKTSGLHSE